MNHQNLPGSGRRTHRDIDAHLPTDQEKLTLRNIVDNAQLELVHPDNTAFDQDDNWRIRINSSGNLVIEIRVSGAWSARATYTP